MKIVAISDTHGQHQRLVLPPGDVLLHAGDVSNRGAPAEVAGFLQWFAAQDYRYRIFIAGNHDFFFEQAAPDAIKAAIPEGVIYLNDSGTVIEGCRVWGSPVTPWYHDWAFNRQRGPDIRQHWDLIPADTDLLLVHGPVHGIQDRTVQGIHTGCEDLLHRVQEIRPRAFICGHIHEAYGTLQTPDTLFINASVLDERYRLVHPPVVFDLD